MDGSVGILWDMTTKTAMVLAILYGVLWLIRRSSGRSVLAGRGPVITVVQTTHLGPGRSLHLVGIGERLLLVGATSHQISLLTELASDEVEIGAGPLPEVAPFDSYLRQAVSAARTASARIKGGSQASARPDEQDGKEQI